MADLDVLIPHYNDPEGLGSSLDSVANQSWTGIKRIVIADDGSRPRDKKAVEALCAGYDMDIRLIHNRYNRGRPYTRNVLLDAIESPYAAWLDAGDIWRGAKLSRQFLAMDFYQKTNPDKNIWITCPYIRIWSRKRKKIVMQISPKDQISHQEQIRRLLMGKSLHAYLWTLLGTARSFKMVGWFDERLPRLQDLDFFLRFLLHGGLLRGVEYDRPLVEYLKTDVGRSGEEIYLCYSYVFDKHRVLYNQYGKNFIRRQKYDMLMLSARVARANKDAKAWRYFAGRAFMRQPFTFIKNLPDYVPCSAAFELAHRERSF
jgi:glycosyltransferase involved in cell wall biosynthesis